MRHLNIAIIGAGVAGLAAASRLASMDAVIFEKSRGPGGRLASKRIGPVRADIGAQFFTVRDGRFQSVVDAGLSFGAIKPWNPRMGYLTTQGIDSSPDTQLRFVGTPYMNAFGRFLADGLQIETEVRIANIQKRNNGYQLTTTKHEEFTANKVIVTTPVTQMSDLLTGFETKAISDRFLMDPTWTLVMKTESQLQDRGGTPLDACFGGDDPVIDFISMERSKPGRENNFVVIQSNPDWAAKHIGQTAESVADVLCDAVRQRTGIIGEPLLAHRWSFARPKDPSVVSQKGLFQVDDGLWIAGDYLFGGRIEGAYLSGLEVAERLLKSL
jgi:hypothetical protein